MSVCLTLPKLGEGPEGEMQRPDSERKRTSKGSPPDWTFQGPRHVGTMIASEKKLISIGENPIQTIFFGK